MGVLVRFGDVESPLYEFYDDKILSISTDTAVNLIGEQLKIDTMTPLVRFMVISPDPLIDSEGVPLVDANGVLLIGYGTGDIRVMPHGTKATLYEVYGDEENLKAVYYVDDVERIAKDQYQINCMSIIGRLEEQKWIGGKIPGITISETLGIILGNNIDYQVSPYIARQLPSGFIPNCTRREALYHFMLAYGIGIYNDRGTLVFRPVGEIGNAEIIPDDRMYMNGKVIYPKPPSSVQVTAHYWDYYPGPAGTFEEHVVWDNTSSLEEANNNVITVDFLYAAYRVETVEGYDPLHTDFDDDFYLVSKSPGEFTIQSGIGKLVLISPPRIDTVYEIVNPDAEVERVVSITDELMISPYNAPNVARRLMDYYKNGKVIENAIILDNEICGNQYEFNNAFGEHETASMTSMQTVYSGITKANCRLVSGLDMAIDFPYTHYIEYSDSQTIDLTALKEQGITSIGVLLVGGGQAGFNGGNGENGESTDPPASGDFILRGGKGGRGGRGGHGGKSNFVTVDLSETDELTLTVGAGGASNGAEGGDTTISYQVDADGSPLIITETSAYGDVFSVGTLNPLSGKAYGAKGQEGVSGGDGGNGGRIFAAKVIDNEWSYSGGAVDENGLPIDVSEAVSAQPGQRAKFGNQADLAGYPPNNPSKGNYGTNLIMYYGSIGDTDIYYSFHGAGGGGNAYDAFGTDGEAVYS